MSQSRAASRRRCAAPAPAPGISSRSKSRSIRLDQLDEALGEGADAVLLDNMRLGNARQGGRYRRWPRDHRSLGPGDAEIGAAIAATGVDLISIGWLTHSAPVLDIGLDFEA